MSRSEHYTCLVTRDDDGRIISLEIGVTDLEGAQRVIRVNGYQAAHVAAPLQELFRGAAMRGRQWSSPKPFELSPTLGAHAELLLRAVKPLRRIDRVTSVAGGIADMSREEANYWHAQSQRRHGLKSLRILLDGGNK